MGAIHGNTQFWGVLFLEARFGARLASRAPNQLLNKSEAAARSASPPLPLSLTLSLPVSVVRELDTPPQVSQWASLA